MKENYKTKRNIILLGRSNSVIVNEFQKGLKEDVERLNAMGRVFEIFLQRTA